MPATQIARKGELSRACGDDLARITARADTIAAARRRFRGAAQHRTSVVNQHDLDIRRADIDAAKRLHGMRPLAPHEIGVRDVRHFLHDPIGIALLALPNVASNDETGRPG